MVSMIWGPKKQTNMSTIGNGNPGDVRGVDGDAPTYLPGHGRLTHEHLVVGGELRGVVVHVFDPDVDTDFGVLVMAACTRVDKKTNKTKKTSSAVRFLRSGFSLVLEYVCPCLSPSSPPQLTMNNSQQGCLSIRASQT